MDPIVKYPDFTQLDALSTPLREYARLKCEQGAETGAVALIGQLTETMRCTVRLLQELPDDTYVITDKGREHEEITCDAIAYPVMQRALMAVQRYNTRIQRKGLIETKIEQEETGDYLAQLCLRDDAGVLMKLELAAPTLSQARTLVRAYEKQADAVYQQLLCQLLDEKESGHAEL